LDGSYWNQAYDSFDSFEDTRQLGGLKDIIDILIGRAGFLRQSGERSRAHQNAAGLPALWQTGSSHTISETQVVLRGKSIRPLQKCPLWPRIGFPGPQKIRQNSIPWNCARNVGDQVNRGVPSEPSLVGARRYGTSTCRIAAENRPARKYCVFNAIDNILDRIMLIAK
jgi:hypothetical protein